MARYEFSRAQREVAEHLIKGLSNQEIADLLFVCEKTIKFHITAILKIAGVKSRHSFIAKVLWDKISSLDKKLKGYEAIAASISVQEAPKKDSGIPDLPR